MKKIFKKRKYLIVAIAIMIMIGIYLMRIHFIKEIENMNKTYEKGIDFINIEKNYNKAINQFFLYLKKKPNDIDTLFSIGYCYFMLGDFDKAIDYLKKAHEYNPLDFQNLDYLAQSYVEIEKNKEYLCLSIEILNKIEKILKHDKELWTKLQYIFLETKGWIFFKVGKTQNALRLYDKVIPIRNNSFIKELNEYNECFSPVHFHFGMIHLHNRDFLKAKKEFNKAIKAGGPQNIFAKRSKTELEKLKK